MNHEEYVKRVLELEQQLMDVTQQYVQSEQIYKEGEYLIVSFPKFDGKIRKVTCKIMNVYPQNTESKSLSSFGRHPKGKLEYFARYVRKNYEGKIIIGDVCYLGELSHSQNTCGYMRVNWDDVNIEVIPESEVLTIYD